MSENEHSEEQTPLVTSSEDGAVSDVSVETEPPRLVFKGEKRPEVAQSVAAVFLLTLGLAAVGSGAWGGAWRNAAFVVHLVNVGLLYALLERLPWGDPDRRKVSALAAAFIFGAFPVSAAFLLASGSLATAASMGFALAGLLLVTLPAGSTTGRAFAPLCMTFAGLCTPWGLLAAVPMVAFDKKDKVRQNLVIVATFAVLTVSAALNSFPIWKNPDPVWLGSIAPLATDYAESAYTLYLAAALAALLIYRIQLTPRLKVVRNLALLLLAVFSVVVSAWGSYAWRNPTNMLDRLTKYFPQNALMHRCLGYAILDATEKGMTDGSSLPKAEAAFRKAAEFAPNDAKTDGGLGRVLNLAGRADDAIPLLVSALTGDSRQSACAAALAEIYADKARFARKPVYIRPALDYFRAADAAGALKAPALVSYAILNARMGDVDNAVALLTRAAFTAQAELFLSGQVSGDSQAFVSMIKQRIEEFQAASKRQSKIEKTAMGILGKQPEDPAGMKLLAELLVLRSQENRARYILGAICKEGIPDLQTWLLLGTVAARTDSAKSFIAQYSTPPASTDEAGRDPWGTLVKRCMQDQTWDAAAAYCAVGAGDRPVWPLLAKAAMEASQQSGAIAHLSTMQDNDPARQLALADLYLNLKDKAAAQNAISRARELGASEADIAARSSQI